MHDRSNCNASFSLRARLASLGYAWRGLYLMGAREHNAWVHLAASIAVVGGGLVLNVSARDWCALLLAMALVWLAEAFNTAIEALCDRVEPRFDEAIRSIKDIAAGGVLIAAVAAAAIGFMTLGPPFLVLLT
ncbi:diacylglycerol kinase family protein [Novosphingobium clariflavum]|uniref:Diacylglycerol kinase family protein n=1 Tax=Novosphingobium clariflavum TaxID=2029884 RepID=A0ABV6S1M2_9SPHN|nr:diacylglycerol kinase family protein [Novosphingobium clariflavum]